jgi:DhnA family fructose-bisphosphate aldolase class Ia
MGLRVPPISDAEFFQQAATLKAQLLAVMDQPAQHLGLRRLQDLFRATAHRL